MNEIESLLQEVIDWHSDPESADYNGCNNSPCDWCQRANAVLDKRYNNNGDVRIKHRLIEILLWLADKLVRLAYVLNPWKSWR